MDDHIDPRNGTTFTWICVNDKFIKTTEHPTRVDAINAMTCRMEGAERVLCRRHVFEDRIEARYEYLDEGTRYQYDLVTTLEDSE